MSNGIRGSIVLCALFLLAVPALSEDRVATEFERLQGAWVVQGGEHGGKPMDWIKGGVLTITDRAFALHTSTGSDFPGHLRIDPFTLPLALDFVHDGGTVWEAIYAVDGDAFMLNYVEAGGREKRPTRFETGSDTEASIIVLQKK